jgi:NIPSNAP
LNQLNQSKSYQLLQFAFDNFRRRLLSFPPRRRVLTSCRQQWERVLIYEIRVYEAAEGRADAMRRRFRDHVVTQFFPRHGIELLGVFTAPVEDGRLTYMTRFADEDARKKAWASFAADPAWAAVKAASETDGPLLKNQTVSVLSPAVAGLPLG